MHSYQQLWVTANCSDTDFIYFARAFYEHKTERRHIAILIGLDVNARKELIRWLFKLAHDYGRFLDNTFEEFEGFVTGRNYNYRPWPVSSYWRGRRGVFDQLEYRERASFRHKGEEKKEKYNQKEEYRRSKGLYRDKAKGGWSYLCGKGIKKQGKKEYNVWHRRHERRELKAGRWESLGHVLRKPWLD